VQTVKRGHVVMAGSSQQVVKVVVKMKCLTNAQDIDRLLGWESMVRRSSLLLNGGQPSTVCIREVRDVTVVGPTKPKMRMPW